MPPAPGPAREGAPSAELAAKSPAPLGSGSAIPRAPVAAAGKQERAEEPEPYLEDLAAFALESELRDFLIRQLPRLSIGGKSLRLFRDSAGRSGREYPTAVGPIDVLAVASDGSLVVMELKLERGPDRALGQLARYMGWVQANLAGGREVRGAVVASRIDEKLRYAAAAMSGVTLLEYELDFRVREVAAHGPPSAGTD
jgi:hypothetical protein